MQKAINDANQKAAGPPRPPKRDYIQKQYIVVRQKDGKTVTSCTPDNRHLLESMAKFYFDTTLVLRCIRFEDHHVPPEYEAFAERAAKLVDLPYVGAIKLPITFRNLRIAVEREKEFGGHIREWPDLRAEDEPIIQMKREEGNDVS